MTGGNVDRMVEAWLVSEFRSNYPDDHLSSCPTAYATIDHECTGWECGCYSSWTREDSFVVIYSVQCEHGNDVMGERSHWYNSPTSVYEQLDAYREGPESVCHVEQRREYGEPW